MEKNKAGKSYEKVEFEQWPEGGTKVSHVEIWGQNCIPRASTSTKVLRWSMPGVPENNRGVSVAGAEGAKWQCAGDNIWQITGTL